MKTKSTTTTNSPKHISHSTKSTVVNIESLPWYTVYLPFHFTTIIHNTLHFHFWKTIMVLSLPISLALGIQFIQFMYPYSLTYREDLIALIKNVYPEELIININDGIVSTNVEEPYEIAPSIFDPDDKNFMVIDTQAEVENYEEFSSYNTNFLLTNDTILVHEDGDNENIQIFPISPEVNGVISQNLVLQAFDYADKNFPLKGLIYAVMVIVPLLLVLGLYSGTLFMIVMTTIPIWLISKMCSLHIPFTRLMKYTVAVGAIWILGYRIVFHLLPFVGVNLPYLGFIIHIITLTLAYLGFKTLSDKKTPTIFQSLITAILLPYFLAKDLFASSRSTEKKILLSISLLIFFTIPWLLFAFSFL